MMQQRVCEGCKVRAGRPFDAVLHESFEVILHRCTGLLLVLAFTKGRLTQ